MSDRKQDHTAPVSADTPDTRLSRVGTRRADVYQSKRRDGWSRILHNRSWLGGCFIVLMLGLIAFAVYQCARHLSVNLNTLRTQEITDTTYCDLTLYAFRDEETVSAGGGNVFLYTVRDGEKVAAGASLGTAYVSMDGNSVSALQHRLNALGDRIQVLLETEREYKGATVAMNQAERQYRAMLTASASGNISGAAQYGEQFLAALEAYRAQVQGESGAMNVSELRQERESLVAGLTEVGTMTAGRAGWFCYSSDGLESAFTTERAMGITVEEFRSLVIVTDQRNTNTAYGIGGKLVCGSQWFAGALISSDVATSFQVGKTYRVLCADAQASELTLTCLRSEQAGAQTLLVFSSSDMPAWMANERQINVQAVLGSVSGYRVPTGALVSLPSPTTGEEVTGVYILTGNRVAFRRVRVLGERDGYTIVMTSAEAQAELADETADPEVQSAVAADGWSFLKLNDRIITDGRNLYEGKVIA